MNALYTHSPESKLPLRPVLLSIVATGSLFALLPILHMMPDWWTTDPGFNPKFVADEPPPVVIEPIPEPEKPKEKIKPPEMEREISKIDLKQLEVLINVGPGQGGGHLRLGDPASFLPKDGIDGLYEIEDLDRKPRALFQVEPVYPYSLKSQRIAGWALLEWTITDRGRVSDIRAIRYSHREFVQPAIDSISKSKWEPGEISRKPVNTRVRQKISFRP